MNRGKNGGHRVAKHQAASANHVVINNYSARKPEEWLTCLPYKLKLPNGTKGWWIDHS